VTTPASQASFQLVDVRLELLVPGPCHTCGMNEQCVNTDPFYSCDCSAGYFNDSGSCVPNPCAALVANESNYSAVGPNNWILLEPGLPLVTSVSSCGGTPYMGAFTKKQRIRKTFQSLPEHIGVQVIVEYMSKDGYVALL